MGFWHEQVDTTRRLWIVLASGFILQGDAVTMPKVAGSALVCFGALAYGVVTNQTPTPAETAAPAPKSKDA